MLRMVLGDKPFVFHDEDAQGGCQRSGLPVEKKRYPYLQTRWLEECFSRAAETVFDFALDQRKAKAAMLWLGDGRPIDFFPGQVEFLVAKRPCDIHLAVLL